MKRWVGVALKFPGVRVSGARRQEVGKEEVRGYPLEEAGTNSFPLHPPRGDKGHAHPRHTDPRAQQAGFKEVQGRRLDKAFESYLTYSPPITPGLDESSVRDLTWIHLLGEGEEGLPVLLSCVPTPRHRGATGVRFVRPRLAQPPRAPVCVMPHRWAHLTPPQLTYLEVVNVKDGLRPGEVVLGQVVIETGAPASREGRGCSLRLPASCGRGNQARTRGPGTREATLTGCGSPGCL